MANFLFRAPASRRGLRANLLLVNRQPQWPLAGVMAAWDVDPGMRVWESSYSIVAAIA